MAPIRANSGLIRCDWAQKEINIPYHDEEWASRSRRSRALRISYSGRRASRFELGHDLLKRALREVFDHFDAQKIARYDARKVRALLADPHHPQRSRSRPQFQRASLFKVQQEFGSFASYLWQFVGGKPIKNAGNSTNKSRKQKSDAMSKDLQKRGFRFVGSTICYAFMQATGMVNDHLVTCFRHAEVNKKFH